MIVPTRDQLARIIAQETGRWAPMSVGNGDVEEVPSDDCENAADAILEAFPALADSPTPPTPPEIALTEICGRGYIIRIELVQGLNEFYWLLHAEPYDDGETVHVLDTELKAAALALRDQLPSLRADSFTPKPPPETTQETR